MRCFFQKIILSNSCLKFHPNKFIKQFSTPGKIKCFYEFARSRYGMHFRRGEFCLSVYARTWFSNKKSNLALTLYAQKNAAIQSLSDYR